MATGLDDMTLADVEALAERLAKAVAVIRVARAELAGGVAAPAIAPVSAPSPLLSAYEVAQREALLARNREALPEAIKRAEGIT